MFRIEITSCLVKPGENLIQRKSIESSLTIPWSQTFRQLERSVTTPEGVEAFCGCGWVEELHCNYCKSFATNLQLLY